MSGAVGILSIENTFLASKLNGYFVRSKGLYPEASMFSLTFKPISFAIKANLNFGKIFKNSKILSLGRCCRTSLHITKSADLTLLKSPS